MGTEDKNNPNKVPDQDIAAELNLTHVHEAAKRIFEGLEVTPEEEFIETGDTGIAEPTQPETSALRTRLTELVEEVEELQKKYEKEGGKELRRRIDKIKEEIFWRREDNDPGKPLNDGPK